VRGFEFPSATPRGPALVLLCLGSAAPLPAQSRAAQPQPWALVGVRLSSEEDAPAKTLLVADGRIVEVRDAQAELPPGWRVLEAEGLFAVPAFVDAWSTTGCILPEPRVEQDRPIAVDANVRIDMRAANRKGIQPSFRAVDVLDLAGDGAGKHRASGFGALVSAPSGEILAGRSVLATTRDAATRDVVLHGELFQHAAFAARGPGYPGTLMGFMAQLRQFLLDVRHQRELFQRHEQGRPGPRPAWDVELTAGRSLIEGERLVCEANLARDIERWMRLADELGLSIAISGGREAWKVADELARREIPVFLSLDWSDEVDDPTAKKEKNKPEPAEGESAEETEPPAEVSEPPEALEITSDVDPQESEAVQEEESAEAAPEGEAPEEKAEEKEKDIWEYKAPEGVRLAKRKEWEEERDCAKRLLEAGVSFAFCTGDSDSKTLLGNLRKLVESGFPAEAALEALTAWPAALVGADRDLGFLTPGHAAAIGLWTASPTSKDAQIAWLFVDGYPYEFEIKDKKSGGGGDPPAEGVDLSGDWLFESDSENEQEPARVTLVMAEDGSVTGEMKAKGPGGESVTSQLSGQLAGTTLHLEGTLSVQGLEIEVLFDAELSADELKGTRQLKSEVFEDETTFVGTRVPGSSGAEGSESQQ
jgi:imidazolonepropionase-like amidohydrolase